MAVLGVLQAVAPLAHAAGESATPAPGAVTAPSASPSASPTAGTDAGGGQPGVPVATMTPQSRDKITLILFDQDIVLVGGRAFSPGSDVTVAAQTDRLGGSALTRADTDGRFILGFRVPDDFAGTVTVKATQGTEAATDSLAVTGPEAAARRFRAAPPLPNEPVVTSPSVVGAQKNPSPSPSTSPSLSAGTAAGPSPTVSANPFGQPSLAPSPPLATASPSPGSSLPSASVSPSATSGTMPFPTTPLVSTPTVTAPTPGPSQSAPVGTGSDSSDIDNTSTHASGLPWMSGVHPADIVSQVLAFGDWRGRPNDATLLYTIRDGGWDGLVNPTWPVDTFKSFPGKLVISEPTFPQGQGDNASCARGDYDSQWTKLGTFLVGHGRADSIIRIGWEFNGDFMYWHTDADPTAFRDCFRKIATAIRSTDPQVKIDWTFNAHNSPVPSGNSPWGAYPGDEYVDYVGIDAYDHYPPSKDEATWNQQCQDVNGLCYVVRFAQEHGKKVGVGEWGVASCSGDGGGDNPFYIQKMYETFKAAGAAMGYETYFHDAAPGNVCSTIENGGQNPKAAAEYKKDFGSG